MKKMICIISLVTLASCGHFGGCHKGEQHQCSKAKCEKCPKMNEQCPMAKTAPATEEPAKK